MHKKLDSCRGAAGGIFWLALPLLVGIAFLAFAQPGDPDADHLITAEKVSVVVDTPRPNQVIRSRLDMAHLKGNAISGNRPTDFDVMLVLDVSGSTAYPSGADVDGDGEVGAQAFAPLGATDHRNTDPGDSILAAEIQASRALVDNLDPERVRVGVVSFSGEFDPETGRGTKRYDRDALLDSPLTSDMNRVRARLTAIEARAPYGGTNMEAGVKLALRELAGLEGARSKPRPGAKPIILLLTDGKPSLPFGGANVQDQGDIDAVIAAGKLAAQAGITVNTYGLGPSATDYPVAVTELAQVTRGLYTPVRRPGDIVNVLRAVSFSNVDDVVAVNLTMGEMSGPEDILLAPDGSFSGFVPVQPGTNRIRVSALASDGSRGTSEFSIIYKGHQGADARLRAEREEIRRRNRELRLAVERRRQGAFRREERTRMLEIEVEKAEDDEGQDKEN